MLEEEVLENEPVVDELTLLRERANKLGLRYSNRAGVETLKKQINEFLEPKEETKEEEESEPKKETMAQLRTRVRNEALKLIRCKIVNLNPSKRDLEGEFFTVANAIVGKVTKYVPYTSPASDSWHLPKIIVDHLKGRMYVDVRPKQDRKNRHQIEVSSEFVPEFNIIELPPLTKEELAKLAAAQTAAGNIEE